jgi:hypothetical protein
MKMERRGRNRSSSQYNFFTKNRRGQVTIFIIVAIIIVAGALLIFSFLPQLQTTFGGGAASPQAFIQTCMEKDIQTSVDKLSLQGGSLNPVHYMLYNDEKVEYLCYTNEFYKNCVVQQPLLKQHIESEIMNDIKSKADACFNSMRESYIGKGYTVEMSAGIKRVELLPKRVIMTFNNSVTLTKGSDVQRYNSFNVILNNNLYEFISIANSIIEWEATYGNAETTTYMNYYHDLKVEKKNQLDGTTIYILTDRNAGNSFQFASRSVVMPPGYGVGK